MYVGEFVCCIFGVMLCMYLVFGYILMEEDFVCVGIDFCVFFD